MTERMTWVEFNSAGSLKRPVVVSIRPSATRRKIVRSGAASMPLLALAQRLHIGGEFARLCQGEQDIGECFAAVGLFFQMGSDNLHFSFGRKARQCGEV